MSNADSYRRTWHEVRAHASLFWPESLTSAATRVSVLPLLLETRDAFLAILSFPVRDAAALYELIRLSTLPANLFLKHLMVLTDVGGEPLQRINDNFARWFPDGHMAYVWQGQEQHYRFEKLPLAGRLTNSRMGVTGKRLARALPLSGIIKDVIALLTFGASSQAEDAAPELAKCDVSDYIGQPEALSEHVKRRYLWVSRIMAGSQSNSLGLLAETFVESYLREELADSGIQLVRNGTIPGISHTAEGSNRLTTFDIVAAKGDRYVAVEVTFQVTTNSVIERKAREASARFRQLEQRGHKIAYVLDGAGNFQRENALATICNHSHCTVAFSESELLHLSNFICESLP